jgi:ComB9 competence protein
MTFFFTLLLLIVSFNVSAEIVDEINQGANIPESAIINRPMNAGLSLNAIQAAFDSSDAVENTLVVRYQNNVTYKVRLREFVTTQFILPDGEQIAAHSMGDKTNFEFIPFKVAKYDLGNMFTVRPMYAGADTNLTIIGESGNIYSFYLRSDSFESKIVPHFVVKVNDSKEAPKETHLSLINDFNIINVDIKKTDQDYLKSLPDFDIKNMNPNYVMSKDDRSLAPTIIFDDGYWTYFVYDDLDKPSRLPVFYKVIDGYDTPAITRRVGNMIIAESISTAWTLRNGKTHLCVRLKK